MENIKTLGDAVNHYRRQLNLTKAELADDAGFSWDFINKIESDRINFPSGDIIKSLAAGIGVSEHLLSTFSTNGILGGEAPDVESIARAAENEPYMVGTNHDPINSPSHYQGRYEVIDMIEQLTANMEGHKAYCLGNTVKYLFRHEHKNGVEDLKKAAWYLNRAIYTEGDNHD